MKHVLLVLTVLLCSCSKGNKEVVAEINGHKLYASELSQVTTQETFDLLNMAYEIKSRALDDLIKQKLIEYEAIDRGVLTDEFLNAYIDSVMVDPTKEYMEDLLAKNRVRSVLIRHLADSLFNRAQIKRYIYPPKQPNCVVADLCVQYRGNLDAATHLIVASDFNCKRCAEFEKTLKRIYDKYHDRVKFGFINFADEPNLASLACEAAGKYGKFWEFHDAIFSYDALPDSAYIFDLARALGLDVSAYKQDVLSAETYDKVNHTIDKLMERGLFATPTIIINNRLVYITNSYEELTKLLDKELQNE